MLGFKTHSKLQTAKNIYERKAKKIIHSSDFFFYETNRDYDCVYTKQVVHHARYHYHTVRAHAK